MPIEQTDNTRVSSKPIPKEQIPGILQPIKQDLLWDADKVLNYLNLLNFYNSNFWRVGPLTNYDPHTQQLLIQNTFNQAKANVLNVATTLATAGAMEGIDKVLNYLTTPIIDGGAEAIAYISKFPLGKVTKISPTITPGLMLFRTTIVPGSLKTKFIGKTKDGYKYILNKVRKVSGDREEKVLDKLEKLFLKNKWKREVYPNYGGRVYRKGDLYMMDLESNVGETLLLRQPVIYDPTVLFRKDALSLLRKNGGTINKN